MREKFLTFNGCWRSKIAVTPSNWNTLKASIRRPWRISYRFYDPAFRGTEHWGKQITIKQMNDYRDLVARQEIIRGLIEREKKEIDIAGFNPITGQYMAPSPGARPVERLTAETPLIRALELAIPFCDVASNTQTDLESTVRFFGMSAEQLQLADLPVSKVTRGMIMEILDNCANLMYEDQRGNQVKKIWNDNQYNVYRKYLKIVYGVLDTKEIMEYNPIDKIPIKENVKEDIGGRAILSPDEITRVADQLLSYPTFNRFIHIFFQSGARFEELLRVQVKHVNLSTQRFRVLIKKRKKKTWVNKTITDWAVPLWRQLVEDRQAEDYLFGKGLQPGPKPIRHEQITRRWQMHIKEKLGIEADAYSLKHLYDTVIKGKILEFEKAIKKANAVVAAHNDHTSDRMVEKVYDVDAEARYHELRKTLGMSLRQLGS